MPTLVSVLTCAALSLLTLWAGAAETDGTALPTPGWGASQSVVLQGRSKPLHAGAGGVVYKTQLGAVAALITFRFTEDELTEVRYRFVTKHAAAEGFLADFEQIEALLVTAHGEPEMRQAEWIEPGERTAQLAVAIATGKLSQLSQWRTSASAVVHSIYGDDGKISHTLVFQPLSAYQPLFVEQPAAVPTAPEPPPAAPAATPR